MPTCASFTGTVGAARTPFATRRRAIVISAWPTEGKKRSSMGQGRIGCRRRDPSIHLIPRVQPSRPVPSSPDRHRERCTGECLSGKARVPYSALTCRIHARIVTAVIRCYKTRVAYLHTSKVCPHSLLSCIDNCSSLHVNDFRRSASFVP